MSFRIRSDSVNTLASDEEYGTRRKPDQQVKHEIAGSNFSVRPSRTHIAASNDNDDTTSYIESDNWDRYRAKGTEDFYQDAITKRQIQPNRVGFHARGDHTAKKALGAFTTTFAIATGAGAATGALVGGALSLPVGGIGAIPGTVVGAAAGAVVGVFAGLGAAVLAQRPDINATKHIRQTRDRLQGQGHLFNAKEAKKLSTTPFTTWKQLLKVDTKKVPDKDTRNFIRDEVMKCVAEQDVDAAAQLKADLENMFVGKNDVASKATTTGVKAARRNMNQAIQTMYKERGAVAANQFKNELVQLYNMDNDALKNLDGKSIYDQRLAQDDNIPYKKIFDDYSTPRALLRDVLSNPDADRIMTEFSSDRVHGQDFDKEYRCYKAAQKMLALDPEKNPSDKQKVNEMFKTFQRDFGANAETQANVPNVYQKSLSNLHEHRTGQAGMIPFHTACKYAAENDDFVHEKQHILREVERKMYQILVNPQNNVNYTQWQQHKTESSDNVFAAINPQKLPNAPQ
jgi:hypothetical protein